MLPIGDYPNPPRPQWLTRILVGINVAVHLFVAMPLSGRPADLNDAETVRLVAETRPGVDVRELSRYDIVTMKHGYRPALPDVLALFTCMFLHGDFLHLLGNMLFLWIFGDNVEARLGKVGYLASYLVTGVLATLTFAVLSPKSTIPLVGASGAISGVLGFYLIWFPHNQVRVLFIFFFIHVFYLRAIWWIGFYFLVLQNLLPYFTQRGIGGGGVAHSAHIGGFVAGALGALGLNLVRGAHPAPRPHVQHARARWGTPEARQIVHRPVENPSDRFAAAVRDANMAEAAHAFARIAREGGAPPAPEHVFRLAYWLYEGDFVADAAAVFRYYIKNFPKGPDLDRVHLGLGILLARRLGRPITAREHLLTAIDLGDATVAATARAELDRL